MFVRRETSLTGVDEDEDEVTSDADVLLMLPPAGAKNRLENVEEGLAGEIEYCL